MVSIARQLCTFQLEDLHLGVEVSRVQEVLRMQRLTPVPLAPPVVSGLINLRGQIVTALDLRRRLGLPSVEDWKPMNLVVRSGEEVVSVLVDRIGDVVEVDPAQFERTPEAVRGPVREMLSGAYKLEHGLLLELDISRAIASGAA